MDVDRGREVAARANAYVRGTRIAEMKTRLGNEVMLYDSIRSHNIRAPKARNMQGSEAKLSPYQDGMLECGDGRLLSGVSRWYSLTKGL
jgi:hypothetical protein